MIIAAPSAGGGDGESQDHDRGDYLAKWRASTSTGGRGNVRNPGIWPSDWKCPMADGPSASSSSRLMRWALIPQHTHVYGMPLPVYYSKWPKCELTFTGVRAQRPYTHGCQLCYLIKIQNGQPPISISQPFSNIDFPRCKQTKGRWLAIQTQKHRSQRWQYKTKPLYDRRVVHCRRANVRCCCCCCLFAAAVVQVHFSSHSGKPKSESNQPGTIHFNNSPVQVAAAALAGRISMREQLLCMFPITNQTTDVAGMAAQALRHVISVLPVVAASKWSLPSVCRTCFVNCIETMESLPPQMRFGARHWSNHRCRGPL